MNLLKKLFGSAESALDVDTEANLEFDPEASSSHIPRPLDDFAVSDIDPVYEGGRETLVQDTDDGEAYAGRWPREMFENAAFNNTQPTWIGYEESRNPLEGVNEIGVLHEELNSHMAVFGATGFGKSTLLLNMMTQWAYAGYGFCFIDPKGQDAYQLLRMLPEHRLDDVYWMEPGSVDHDKVIGMNFLHTHNEPGNPRFDNEAGRVIDDLIPILQASTSGWGARMESIIRNVTRKMLEDDQEYNLLDIYTLLSEEEYRNDLPKYYDDDLLKQRANHIAEMDADDIEPVLRRFQMFAENRSAREVVAHRESDVDAHEVINNDKIIILRTAEVAEDLQRLIATTVMRRLWSVIAQRSKSHNYDPYFLVADEFGKVAGAGNNVEDMLSRGRSLGLSMTLATQQPSQLDELQDSLGNVKNFISFSPGDKDDARFISEKINMDAEMLMRVPQYNAYSNLSIGNEEKTGPIRTHTFAPYPPLRSEKEAQDVIQQIVDQYGQERIDNDDIELTAHPLKDRSADSTTNDAPTVGDQYRVTDDGDTLPEQEFLECIFDAQLDTGNGDPDSFTTRHAVAKQIAIKLGKDTDEDYGATVSSAIEELPDSYIEKDHTDDVYLQLKPAGHDRVFDVSSGASASAGKLAHRILLEKAYLVFRSLGYDVEIPRQEGRMPDGICKPKDHLNPNTADNFRDAQNRADKLAEQYPRLHELFGTDELHLEPEHSSLSKPKQPFKNLIKAMEKGRKCVYIVKDGEVDGHDFDHYARKIHTWIDTQKFAKNHDGQDRIFYNFSKRFELEGGAVPVKREDGEHQTWREDGNKIILENPEDPSDPYAEFHSVEQLDACSTNDFPYYYVRDQSRGQTVLYHSNGRRLDTYQNKQGIHDDGFVDIRQPFVPERELPEWPLGDDWDGYEIVIIPSDNKDDMSPQLYDVDNEYDEDYVPIFNEDELIASVHSIETDAPADELEALASDTTTPTPDPTPTDSDESDPSDTTQASLDDAITEETTDAAAEGRTPPTITDQRDSTSDNEENGDDDATPDEVPDESTDHSAHSHDPDSATNADEVPIADPDKSTNDVVEESDEVWTKPEPGDDDYNPAKDNSNYRTGHDPDDAHGDWTGGEARNKDEDGSDFENYTPPEERDTEPDSQSTSNSTDNTEFRNAEFSTPTNQPPDTPESMSTDPTPDPETNPETNTTPAEQTPPTENSTPQQESTDTNKSNPEFAPGEDYDGEEYIDPMFLTDDNELSKHKPDEIGHPDETDTSSTDTSNDGDTAKPAPENDDDDDDDTGDAPLDVFDL